MCELEHDLKSNCRFLRHGQKRWTKGVEYGIIDGIVRTTDSHLRLPRLENWSFQGVLEANLCVPVQKSAKICSIMEIPWNGEAAKNGLSIFVSGFNRPTMLLIECRLSVVKIVHTVYSYVYQAGNELIHCAIIQGRFILIGLSKGAPSAEKMLRFFRVENPKATFLLSYHHH